MKLLIFTQKVDKNDDLLGFFQSWIIEFAKKCESVIVVCLFMGEHSFPDNVKVLSLGKEKVIGKNIILQKIIYTFNFYKIIWQERKNFDSVFVHMNVIYVLLGGWLWKVLGKQIGLWHAHGKTRWNLVLAEKIVDHIFTSTPEGCRMESDKIRIVGQGIDVARFTPVARDYNSKLKIVTVGRISPVKDYETIIQAVEILRSKIDVYVDIIGGAGLAGQEVYLDELKKMVDEKGLGDVINFAGSVPNNKIIDYLHKADVFVNASHTGSLDKAMLEAMACGLPVITCNEAIASFLQGYGDKLIFTKKDYIGLSEKILAISQMNNDDRRKISSDMRSIVVDNHNVKNLITKIVSNY